MTETATLPKRIFLMCDYSADPVWLDYGPMWTLDELPLSASLKEQIRAWADWFEQTSHTLRADGGRLLYFSSDDEERAFEREGLRLWQLAQEELSGLCEIGYRSQLTLETLWP